MEPISKIKCDVCKRHFTHEYNTPLRDETKLPKGAIINQLVIHHMTWPTTKEKPKAFNIATIQEKVERVSFHCPICDTQRGGSIAIMSDMAFDYIFADWHDTK